MAPGALPPGTCEQLSPWLQGRPRSPSSLSPGVVSVRRRPTEAAGSPSPAHCSTGAVAPTVQLGPWGWVCRGSGRSPESRVRPTSPGEACAGGLCARPAAFSPASAATPGAAHVLCPPCRRVLGGPEPGLLQGFLQSVLQLHSRRGHVRLPRQEVRRGECLPAQLPSHCGRVGFKATVSPQEVDLAVGRGGRSLARWPGRGRLAPRGDSNRGALGSFRTRPRRSAPRAAGIRGGASGASPQSPQCVFEKLAFALFSSGLTSGHPSPEGSTSVPHLLWVGFSSARF